ncbi:MAG: protease modulator HflC [Bdellovibrionales bacterium]|jgi:modulator of FtsH protease HflC|nr:protease modulator HflC [Bdellovibrionales bacterium]
MNKSLVIGIVIFASLIVAKNAIFTVTEGEQAIVTELGRPVRAITNSGLAFKIPFFQDIRYVDKRILAWDGFPSEIPTKDKKYIKVDTTARWRIVDTLKFIQTVQNERGAKARLDAILDATTRDVVSNQNLVEVVRNSNAIIDKVKEKKAQLEKNKQDGNKMIEEEITGEIEPVLVGREKLSSEIARDASKELTSFGIKLIDVQLRRISYEKSVEKKVYDRMISERQRIAQKIISIGQGERAKIEGRIARDLRRIESLAYKKSEEIKGKAEGISTKIYAKSLNVDPSFFSFQRSLEAYKRSLSKKTNFILSSDSEFLKFIKRVN